MRSKEFFIAMICLLMVNNAIAWGTVGHRVIGRAAFGMLDDTARNAVMSLIGNPLENDIEDALSRKPVCNGW